MKQRETLTICQALLEGTFKMNDSSPALFFDGEEGMHEGGI